MKINRFYITITLFIIKSACLFAQVNPSEVHVKSYVKDNGTIIQSHQRTAPNSTNSDNFSTKGNINPYTGKLGWISSDNLKPNTYYTNYSYEVDSSKLDYERKYGTRDYLLNKKLEEVLKKEALEKFTNSHNNYYYFEEEDHNLSEDIDEEDVLSNQILEIQNSDLPIIAENNLKVKNITDSKLSQKVVENKKEWKPNKHNYIIPIVIVLSLIIIFFKENIK